MIKGARSEGYFHLPKDQRKLCRNNEVKKIDIKRDGQLN